MFSWQWLTLKRRARIATKVNRGRAFRPRVGELEDRITPSGVGLSEALSSFLQSAPATHLQVVTPDDVQSGKSFDVVVAAETASNRVATGYTGTVHFSLGTADAAATLPPSDYTFKASDHGVHTFHVTLNASGSQKIAATDTTTSTITGSATLTVDPAPVASQFLVRLPDHVTSGQPASMSVVALDASGRPVTNYTGTISFTSSDSAATLPAKYTFTADDHGKHTFQVTLGTTGTQTVTATDAANSAISGKATTAVNAPGAVTHFGVRSLGIGLAGTASPVQIVALDATNHIVSNYTGTIHFTSTDSAATLPADYKFTADDKGSHQFSVTFVTAGKQTLTATDSTTGSTAIVGSGDLFILPELGDPGRRFRLGSGR